MSKIHILHENKEWFGPLAQQLHEHQLPYEEWYMHDAYFDLGSAPPDGVFYSRMSASAHTREHRFSPEYTGAVLAWLEQHNRRVLNGSRALQLELSKVAQYAALAAAGIRTPRTYAAIGREQITQAAAHFGGDAFITKHNRAGKGLGVHLFLAQKGLVDYVNSEEFEHPVDGITLVQEYIESADPFITRCEFVGQKFLYAVRVDNTQGFLLCPADECEVDLNTDGDSCPTANAPPSKFHIDTGFTHPILEQYRAFFQQHDIHIAGIEFIVDSSGELYTYDVNINTNYNTNAEKQSGISGMCAIADYLRTELNTVHN